MSIHFNADEIFAIAEKIEHNGAKFYRGVAERTACENKKQALLHLAEMEEQHEKIFVDMRTELSDKDREYDVFDPDHEVNLYLQEMANGRVFDTRSVDDLLSGQENLETMLKTALSLEKDAVVFYTAMRELTPENFGRDKIDRIIREEMKHISILSKELATL